MYALYWTSQVALVVKNLPANAGDVRDAGSIPESEGFPGGGNGNPLQYSCLKNPMDRGAWWATIHRVAKSWIRLKDLAYTHTPFIMLQYIFFYTQLFSVHSCFYTQLFELFFYTQLFEMFYRERMLSFVTYVFCIFCYGYIIFIFHSINVKCHTY